MPAVVQTGVKDVPAVWAAKMKEYLGVDVPSDAVGVLQDILVATPLGMTVLTLMVVHGLAVTQRRAFLGKPFVLAWFGFVLIYALAAFLVWLLASILALRPVGPEPAVFQYLLTVTLFPAVAWIFVRVHRHVVR